MQDLWLEYGAAIYAVVFVWTFFEGETIVLVGGAAARLFGAPDPLLLFACAWIGSFLGDQCWFLLGRRYGRKLLDRRPKLAAKADKALALLDRHGVAFIMSFRFLYGVRNVASVSIGMSAMSWRRFATLNFVAAALWAASFVGGGYFLGALLGVKGVALLLLGIVVTALVAVLVRHWLRVRATRRAARPLVAAGD